MQLRGPLSIGVEPHRRPTSLREVRDFIGEQRVTIVFDRGGWTPKLFGTMIKDGFDLLTYRKGGRRINERRFIRPPAELDECTTSPMGFLKGKLRLCTSHALVLGTPATACRPRLPPARRSSGAPPRLLPRFPNRPAKPDIFALRNVEV